MTAMKKLFAVALGAALVICLAGPSWALFDDKFEDEFKMEKVAVNLVREVQRGGYDVITTEELKKWIDQGKDMLIIDNTPFEMSYKKNHVPGAKQFQFPMPDMPEWDVKETAGKTQEDYKALLGDDPNKTIVVYCGLLKCGRSHNAATWAKKMGYNHVYRVPGGIFAWKGADYKVEAAE
jgi:rhodanese-related sulfurtransferase